jgi:mannosyltransferase
MLRSEEKPCNSTSALWSGRLDFLKGIGEARIVAKHKTLWEVLGLVVVASVVRFVSLDHPLWLDEAASILFAWQGYGGVVDALAVDSTPPLFYWLLTGWIAVFGDSEIALRALPATGGVLSVLATWYAARRLFPNKEWLPLVAGLLIALSPLAVYYGRECRMYAFCPLIAALALSTLNQALAQNTLRRWLAYSVVLTFGLYTHNFVVFLVPLAPLAALLVPNATLRGRTFVWALGASGGAVLAFSPWLPILVEQAGSGVTAWIPAVWEGTPPSMALFYSLEAMGVGGVYPDYLRGLSALDLGTAVRWISVLVLVGLLPWRWVRNRDHRRPLGLAILLLVLTTVVPWGLSFIKPIYVVGRYELLAIPALALLMAAGVQSLPRGLGLAALVVWLGLAGWTWKATSDMPINSFERDLAAQVHEQAGEGDVVVFTDYSRAVGEYYLQRWGSKATRKSYPSALEKHPGWYDVNDALAHPRETWADADALGRELAAVLREGRRVFVVDHTPGRRIQAVNSALYSAICHHMGKGHPSCLPRLNQPPVLTGYGPAVE